MTHDSFLVSFFRGGSDIFGGVYIHDLEGQKGTPCYYSLYQVRYAYVSAKIRFNPFHPVHICLPRHSDLPVFPPSGRWRCRSSHPSPRSAGAKMRFDQARACQLLLPMESCPNRHRVVWLEKEPLLSKDLDDTKKHVEWEASFLIPHPK